jgi:hypothetical protein
MKARRAHPERTIPPRTALSRSAFAPTPNALEREWLVTNGHWLVKGIKVGKVDKL